MQILYSRRAKWNSPRLIGCTGWTRSQILNSESLNQCFSWKIWLLLQDNFQSHPQHISRILQIAPFCHQHSRSYSRMCIYNDIYIHAAPGWAGWMASSTQWTWAWVNSGRWWRTRKPGVLQSLGLQSQHYLATEQQQQIHCSVQFSSVAQLCLTLCDPMDCSTPGLLVQHQLQEFTQTCVHWVSDAIQPSCPLSCPSPPAFSLSQHQDLFKWVSSSHQVAKVLEFQLQHQSFQCIFRTYFL